MCALPPTLLADRRSHKSPLGRARGLEVRRSGLAAPPSGLTRREHRVKDILLKELNTIGGTTKTWAAYQERQHLVGRLDGAFIDHEIAKMEHSLRPQPVLAGALALLGLAYLGWHSVLVATTVLTWASIAELVFSLITVASMWFGPVAVRRATRRRLWIYEALRELSDADDEGVQLDESVRLADLPIDRIVDAEEAAASAPLHRIRTH